MSGESTNLGEKLSVLQSSAWTLASWQAAMQSGLVQALTTEPQSVASLASKAGLPQGAVPALLDVLSCEGFVLKDDSGCYAAPKALAEVMEKAEPKRHEVQMDMSLQEALVKKTLAKQLGGGWNYDDPLLLNSIGKFSAAGIPMLMKMNFPDVPGLEQSISQPGARLLDVGSGVGEGTAAVAKAFPESIVVGVDGKADANAMAQALFKEQSLEARCSVKECWLQDLDRKEPFDFVWMPVTFFSTSDLKAATPVALQLLKPGAFLLAAGWNAHGDTPPMAQARLKAFLWGDNDRNQETTKAIFVDAGFEIAHEKLLGPVGLIIARRPSA